MNTEPFRLDVDRRSESASVHPAGELDLATVGRVEQELRALREAGVRSVVLDLRGLTFMDSTGLALTLRWSFAAAQDGFDFSLVPGPRQVQRVFELAGMTERVHFRSPAG